MYFNNIQQALEAKFKNKLLFTTHPNCACSHCSKIIQVLNIFPWQNFPVIY